MNVSSVRHIEYGLKLINPPKPTEWEVFEAYIDLPKDHFFHRVEHWHRARIETKARMSVSYYVQEAGKEIKRHKDTADWPELSCYNFKFKGEAPMMFDDGPIYYESALIDVNNYHSIPAADERMILKCNLPFEFETAATILDHHFEKNQEIYWEEFVDAFNIKRKK